MASVVLTMMVVAAVGSSRPQASAIHVSVDTALPKEGDGQ